MHLATIAFCIVDAFGKILWEGVFGNTAETIRDFLGGIRGEVHLTFEQGTLAAWLYDLVRPLVSMCLSATRGTIAWFFTETNRIESMLENWQNNSVWKHFVRFTRQNFHCDR